MDNEKRAAMRQKLAANSINRKLADTEAEKQRIAEEIGDFYDRYRFADDEEKRQIQCFKGKLHIPFPGHIACDEDASVCDGLMEEYVYLAFLGGSKALLGIYVCGKCSDILSDADSWEMFSPFLLLIGGDMERYIYIDDSGRKTGARLG